MGNNKIPAYLQKLQRVNLQMPLGMAAGARLGIAGISFVAELTKG